MTREQGNIAPLPQVVGESEHRAIQALSGLASRAINAFLDRTETALPVAEPEANDDVVGVKLGTEPEESSE